ncbi:MAG: hypothetical protein OQK05_00105 [Pseudopelagicola sp.]|nr:hypothetical protein [Pseudopelagicola sp.]
MMQYRDHVSLASVLDAVSKHRHVSIKALKSPLRERRIAWPRQEFMFLAHELTGFSLSVIGNRVFRDHTTVMHGIAAVRHRMRDPEYKSEMEAIMGDLGVAVLPRFYRSGALEFVSRRSAHG